MTTPVTFACSELSAVKVPRFVREELTTPLPSVVDDKTSVPLILNVLPEARSQLSLDLSEEDELFQVIVLRILAEPIPIPPPSRMAFVPTVVAIPTL